MKCLNCKKPFHVRIYNDGTMICDHCEYKYNPLDKLIYKVQRYNYDKNGVI